ncbi:hypothetical protein AgCh_030652 [Apium graveolens]
MQIKLTNDEFLRIMKSDPGASTIQTVETMEETVVELRSRDEVNANLENWRALFEAKGLRLSRLKTEYLWANFSAEPNEYDVVVCLGEDEIPLTTRFKY